MIRRDAVISYSRTALGIAVTVMIASILFSIAISSIAFVIAGVAFLFLALLEPRSVLRTSSIDYFLLGWIAAVLLMVLFATWPGSALNGSRRLLLMLMVFFIPAAFPSSAALRRFLMVLAIAAAAHSLLGILHHFMGTEERLGYFQHYMTGGGLRMILLLLFLPLLMDRNTQRTERSILVAAVLLMLVALVLTMTRSSWLGFAAGAIVIGALRYRLLLPALAIVLVLIFLIAPRQYRERLSLMFTTQQTELRGETGGEAVVQSNQTRMRMWRTGWQMFLDHPLVGVGDGEMYSMYRAYVPDAIKDEGGHLHNTYVHVLATHGVIGFVAMLALFGGIAWREWGVVRREKGNEIGALALGALAAFAGFLVNGMAEYNFGDHEIVLLMWTTVGLVNAAVAVDFRWSRQQVETI